VWRWRKVKGRAAARRPADAALVPATDYVAEGVPRLAESLPRDGAFGAEPALIYLASVAMRT
jgi:hypothetical protein